MAGGRLNNGAELYMSNLVADHWSTGYYWNSHLITTPPLSAPRPISARLRYEPTNHRPGIGMWEQDTVGMDLVVLYQIDILFFLILLPISCEALGEAMAYSVHTLIRFSLFVPS